MLIAIVVLFAAAWWLVWRYATREWYWDRDVASQVLMAVAMIVWVSIPLLAAVRLVTAVFSERVRNSIASHKLVHVMWLILAIVMSFVSLAPLLFSAKTKG